MSSIRTSLLPGVYSRVYRWARRTSAFAESVISGWDREEVEEPQAETCMIYRLRRWPDLPVAHRTAAIYRMLSVMSSRPVNRSWILASSRMQPRQVDGLLAGLVAQGVVEAIDVSTLARA
jgi:hypothetical protein